MPITPYALSRIERRDIARREALLRRVRAEFVEMPCLSLTAPQAQRLFALRADVCHRILRELVEAATLTVGADGRYRLHSGAGRALAFASS